MSEGSVEAKPARAIVNFGFMVVPPSNERCGYDSPVQRLGRPVFRFNLCQIVDEPVDLLSYSAWRTQHRSVSGVQPIFDATDWIAVQCALCLSA